MLITMEGLDGVGKTTQMNLLAENLRAHGHEVLLTREPGGTELAEEIRGILLKERTSKVSALGEALLYAAARAQHVREIMRPALDAGQVVLCDRFFDSSIAYQAFGRELGIDTVWEINRAAMDGLVPKRTYLLQLPRSIVLKRTSGHKKDRIEQEQEAFFARAGEGFAHIAKENPTRVVCIDTTADAQTVAQRIWEDVECLLRERN